jgi:hypothetical protein
MGRIDLTVVEDEGVLQDIENARRSRWTHPDWLRDRCAVRGHLGLPTIASGSVDGCLRPGVSTASHGETQLLEICRGELQRCRPASQTDKVSQSGPIAGRKQAETRHAYLGERLERRRLGAVEARSH